jgi:hypothetical protein
MVEGSHLCTTEQGDFRLNSIGSSRVLVLDPPWLHEDVQRLEGTVLVGEDEGRHCRVCRSVRHVLESEGRTLEARRVASTA